MGRRPGEFEALTLGTLAVIVVVGLVGYRLGADVRRQDAVLSLDEGEAATLTA